MSSERFPGERVAAGDAWMEAIGDVDLRDLAVERDGAIVLTGEVAGNVDFGGGVHKPVDYNSADSWILELSRSGAYAWSRRFMHGDPVTRIAVDARGTRYLAGTLRKGDTDLGGGKVHVEGPSVILSGYDRMGKLLGTRTFGVEERMNTTTSKAYTRLGVSLLAIAPTGDVTLSGTFHGKMTFAGQPIVSGGAETQYFATYAANGTESWAQALGGDYWSSESRLAIDASGSRWLVANFKGAFAIDGQPMQAPNEDGWWFVEIGPDGRLKRALRPFPSKIYAPALYADRYGFVLAADAPRIPRDGTKTDLLVVRLAPDGRQIWTQTFRAEAKQRAAAVVTDAAGNVFLLVDQTGGREGATNLCGTPIPFRSQTRIVFLALDPQGKVRSMQCSSGPEEASHSGVSLGLDGAGTPILAGVFRGPMRFAVGELHADERWHSFVARLAR